MHESLAKVTSWSHRSKNMDQHKQELQTAMVDIDGEVDLSNSMQIGKIILGALSNSDGVSLVMDRVTFIDASGLRELMNSYNKSTQSDKRFSIINPSRAVNRLIELTQSNLQDVVVYQPIKID